MISIIDINAICDELGTNPPKVVEYANCSAIIIRNGDGVKVLIVAEEGMSRESVKHRIAAAFKVKAENIASADKVAKLIEPDPVTPAKEIRAQQEAKKHPNK